jgi:hypothetical protein
MEIYGKSFYIQLDFDKFLIHFWKKFLAGCFRFLEIFRKFPLRVSRFVRHFLKGFLFLKPRKLYWWESEINNRILNRILNWWIELAIYFCDIFGLPEFYETLMDFVKFNSRSLYDWEIELAKTVFGDSINYKRVRIDELSLTGPKQKNFCYVSFYIINSWGSMKNSTLLHELTHVWQFEQMGSVYIPKALKAQNSKMGYNYGGVSALKASKEQGKSFLSFNIEQQGDIISDYFRIKEGYQPKWGMGCHHDLAFYRYFVDQVK